MTTLRPWVLAVSLLCGLPATAATRIVDDDSPCPGAGSVANPYCSIQRAVDAASTTGDTIQVKPGLYQECINTLVPVAKTLAIQAENADPSLTVIDGTSCFSVSTVVTGAGTTLSGFRMISGGEGAIAAFGSVVISNNVIQGNLAQASGGGIFVDSAVEQYTGPDTIDITIENNVIQGNTSERDGGGIWLSLRSEGTVNATALIDGNTIKGNHAAGVGGGIGAFTGAGFGSSASLRITDNTIQSNVVDSDPNAVEDGFGGGVWVSTLGSGQETITIDHNRVGPPLASPDNSLLNTTTRNGGGISAFVLAADTADHGVFIESNVVRKNTAGIDGGGIDLFVAGDSLDLPSNPTPGRYAVLIADNDVDANAAANFAGGILADVGTFATVSRRNPTDVVGNRITGNTAGLGGGGVDARAFAEGGPATFCAVAVRHNTITNNSAVNGIPTNFAFGGGMTLFGQADGDGVSRLDAAFNTITGNTAEIGGGGIDLASVTETDPSAPSFGTTLFEIANSRIENNTPFGVGAPPDAVSPDPVSLGVYRVTLRSSDFSPNTDGPVEATLDTHRVNVCLPASTAAELAFPGIDSDQDVDGVDLLRVATAFASTPGAVHFNPLTDLDGDLVVDGNDLATLAGSFGQICP